MAEVIDLTKPKKQKYVDLTDAEPLSLLSDDILRDVVKNLGPSDLARLGIADRRMRGISSIQLAEILADPKLSKLAARYKSRLLRPFLYQTKAYGKWEDEDDSLFPYQHPDQDRGRQATELHLYDKGAFNRGSLRRFLKIHNQDPEVDYLRDRLKYDVDFNGRDTLADSRHGAVRIRDQLYRPLPKNYSHYTASYQDARDAASRLQREWKDARHTPLRQ